MIKRWFRISQPLPYGIPLGIQYWSRRTVLLGLTVIIGFMLLIPGITSGQAGGKDQVKLANGEIKSGNITKEDFKGITIASGGSVQEMSWDQVVETEIRYGTPPSQWNAAYVNEKGEKYKEAAEIFSQMAIDMEKEPTKYRDIFKQHVLYGAAYNLQRSAQYEKAISAYDNLLTKIKDTKYVRQSLLNKIKCLLILNKQKEALTAADDAKVHISQIKMEGDLGYYVDLTKAQINESIDVKSAKTLYSQVKMQAASKYPAISDIASIGLGRVFVREKQYDEAEKVFSEITLKPGNNVTALAGAYLGLGDVCFQKAEASGSVNDYHEAVINYLKTNVLYSPGQTGGMDDDLKNMYYAEATLKAGRSFAKMLKFIDEKKRQEYMSFAHILYLDVMRNFPGTGWAKQAEEEDKKLGS